MKSLMDDIRHSLLQKNTDSNRKYWANYLSEKKISVFKIKTLILEDTKIATPLSWVIGDLSQINPSLITSSIPYFFKHQSTIAIRNYHRCLAKMFNNCGVPKAIEGEAVEAMFLWLNDPTIIVSTKAYSMMALLKMCKIYPELKIELKEVIIDQMDKNSISFKKVGLRVLAELRSLNAD